MESIWTIAPVEEHTLRFEKNLRVFKVNRILICILKSDTIENLEFKETHV